MKINLLRVLTITLIVSLLSVTAIAQNQPDLEKMWSKKVPDPNFNPESIPVYNYIPVPEYPRIINLDETDVVVGPNFRPWPGSNTTQSETSVDVHPLNHQIIFASANATNWPYSTIYGTGVYWSLNGANNWTGFDDPPFGRNSGDPASVIGTNGYFYENYIASGGGQGIAVSTNNGTSWSTYSVAPNPGSLADKNHMTIDKQVGSPYENRLYASWTDFGGANNNQVVVRYSTNFGQNWSASINLSSSLNAGSHNQGVHLQTGPNGEVYAAWAIYDGWPGGEDAVAFAKSTNGGVTWTSARIYGALTPNNNFNFGIRGNLSNKANIRVASFPVMAVDRTGGPTNGYIYITWPQRGVTPAGSDPDIVMIRSTDGGTTWSAPVRVNDDALNNAKDQYYPWMTVDQATGHLHFVFYDNRETTSDSSGVYMARSVDAGLTFENYRVSSQNFRPKPISGLASGYQGDYIGIAAFNNHAYPYWADDRTGNYQGWMSVVTFGPAINHTPLTNTENMTGPYIVNATITSTNPLVAGSTKVYWGRGPNGEIQDSIVMTNTGGDNYTASIPGNGLPSIYNYYLAAQDNQGFISTLPGGAPINYFSFEAATDMTPPVITHTPLGNQPLIRWPVDVSAVVTDNISVGSVVCEYSINSGAITGSFPMPLESGDTYKGTFNVDPNLMNIGDVVQYRVKATDGSSQSNVAYHPSTGYHSFDIIDTKGIVLVVNDDVSLEARYSDSRLSMPDLLSPLGESSALFSTTLTDAGYTVDNVSFGALDINVLNNYDIVILSAGIRESTMFGDATKRAAIVNYTLGGGKTIVEGGEVGYVYRWQSGSGGLDAEFRRHVLNDSAWVSDVTNQSIFFKMPGHVIFNDPNVLAGPIAVSNSGGNGWGARDAVRILPNKPGVKKVGTWSTLQDSASIIVYYKDDDSTMPRNIFLTFAVGQITNQQVAKQLIENAAWILSPENIIPVELVSFTANVVENNVTLNWTTATELNNSGFSIERRVAGDPMYHSVGFVPGRGTTTEMSSYTFTDNGLYDGSYVYRLKQIDYDGTFEYSSELYVDITAPAIYALEQNYPNPFNPVTVIKYSIPVDGQVNLIVYNMLGEKVATLVNQVQKAGRHEINFDASQLSSGVYFYKIEAGSFSSVKKMMLLK